ncbi:phosphotransferase family protein [Mycobacterium sp. CVI_P3]|uniref:Phosphotransferase family protein n=1 Tax=Mycobacterium pinniadriaticum TaxID=2994102 RepID=A0ABT3S9Z0_9MYCO|nr:phosphotransferase family protein [Mycobacterium pinniadriaticum]MCX2930015.1 phosphotransferase family protein [Mycobacterium pinniadriaticum]MCX2936336.1 phosphotransferase family protein [Mycobacterium pinniadriaticum]
MALKNEIDTEEASRRLASWLESKIDGAQQVRVTDLDVPASAGLSNETVLFTASWDQDGQHHTRPMVARVQPAGQGVFASYDLGKEASVIGALGSVGVPVPEVYFYEMDPAVFGSPFLVMKRIEGRVPSDDPPFTAGGWVLDLTPEQRTLMWHNSLKALAAIHAADWQALGLGFLDTDANGSGVHAQIANWRDSFTWAAEGEPNSTIEHALEWLADNVPDTAAPKVLNWGDARVGNIIFGDDLAAAAVLDWEMVTLGSRELDLGWWLFLMRHHTEGIGLALPEGIPDRGDTLAYYTSITGYTPADIDYYEILAATKLSIIMVRAAHMMIAMGLMPADSPMALNNPASQLLAKLLGLSAPTGETATFIGNR